MKDKLKQSSIEESINKILDIRLERKKLYGDNWKDFEDWEFLFKEFTCILVDFGESDTTKFPAVAIPSFVLIVFTIPFSFRIPLL